MHKKTFTFLFSMIFIVYILFFSLSLNPKLIAFSPKVTPILYEEPSFFDRSYSFFSNFFRTIFFIEEEKKSTVKKSNGSGGAIINHRRNIIDNRKAVEKSKLETKKTITKKREQISPNHLVQQAWINDSVHKYKRTYGDSSDETILGDKNSKNILWGMEGKDMIIGGDLDDIIIVVGDMTKYGKRDTLETIQILGFPIEKINGINYNINGSPILIDGGGGNDKLFITGDIDLSKTKIEGIEDIKIH